MSVAQPKRFTDDFRSEPYWWTETPRSCADDTVLPRRVDVLVIGSGYTGLCAALQTMRGGRSTLVIDAEDIGWGCSSRNGGQVSTGIKPDFVTLSKRYGDTKARAVLEEGARALRWIGQFVREEHLNCEFVQCGRFHGAHSTRQFDQISRRLNRQPADVRPEAYLVSRAEQSSEINTDYYHGGIVFERHGSLDPGAYHQGLLERVKASGAQVIGSCAALSIEKQRGSSRSIVLTARGAIEADDVIIATGGYTSALTPWQQRRVIPIGSYIIATEDLGACARELIPKSRVVTDTRRVVVYYRLSPDGRRLLFGGRVSLTEQNPRCCAPRLYRQMLTIFPQLRSVKVSHAWMGFVGWTFEQLPHLGRHEGLWYSLGYCGSGVATASYFGTRLGQQVLGLDEGRTALDDLPFNTRPFYYGAPWFLSASVWWYRQLDRTGI